jgi:hypothetical protein
MWQHVALMVATEIVRLEGDAKSEDSIHQELFEKLRKYMKYSRVLV